MKKFLKAAALTTLFIVTSLFVAAIIYFNVVTKDITLELEKLSQKPSLTVLDNDNGIITEGGYVAYDEIPSDLINAFVAVEDKRFLKHKGIDVKRMFGAAIANVKNGSVRQGASTITQQLIKNTHLTSEKSIDRKLKEIKLALMLERKLSKEEILERYLNVIYFGNGIYGVKDACRSFFGKELNELTLDECAAIAGVVKSPLNYSPMINAENSKKRRDLILRLMKEENYISENEYNSYIKKELVVADMKNADISKIYLSNALYEASRILGISEQNLVRSNYKIATYYQKEEQQYLKSSVNGIVSDLKNFDDNNALCILTDNETAGIKAIYSDKTVNIFTLRRQAGSTIKPLAVYLPALENGIVAPASVFDDSKRDFGCYSPSNYGEVYYGNISIRKAVEVSSNIVAVDVLSALGIDNSKRFLSKIGIDIDDNGLSLALGGTNKGFTPAELIGGYRVIAKQGEYSPITAIRAIYDENGRIIYSHEKKSTLAAEKSGAYLMTDILKNVAKSGTAKKLSSLPYDVAAKTGTVSHPADKNKNSDAYNISFTEDNTLFVSMYGTLENNITGGSLPTIIARNVYGQLYDDHYPSDFKMPEGVEYKTFDAENYLSNGKILLSSGENTIRDIFDTRYLPQDKLPVESDVEIELNGDEITIKGISGTDIIIYKINFFGEKSLYSEIIDSEDIYTARLRPNFFDSYEIEIRYNGNTIKSYIID